MAPAGQAASRTGSRAGSRAGSSRGQAVCSAAHTTTCCASEMAFGNVGKGAGLAGGSGGRERRRLAGSGGRHRRQAPAAVRFPTAISDISDGCKRIFPMRGVGNGHRNRKASEGAAVGPRYRMAPETVAPVWTLWPRSLEPSYTWAEHASIPASDAPPTLLSIRLGQVYAPRPFKCPRYSL